MLPVRCHTTTRIPSLFDRWPSLLEELASGTDQSASTCCPTNGYNPDIDVIEFADRYEILVDLPGFKKENVDIEFDEGVLAISATRKAAVVQQPLKEYRKRKFGSFERQVKLPDASAEIDASLEGGVLTLNVSKIPERQPKKIALS